jgi:hypothetical protein
MDRARADPRANNPPVGTKSSQRSCLLFVPTGGVLLAEVKS